MATRRQEGDDLRHRRRREFPLRSVSLPARPRADPRCLRPQPVTWTPARYLAESFAKLLATKSVDELAALKEIRLSGYTATQNDIVKLYEAAHGVTLDVTYVPLDEVEQIEADLFAAGGGEGVVNYWTQWPAFIRAQIAKGNALLDGPFTTVEGATLPEWKDVLSNLPVTV